MSLRLLGRVVRLERARPASQPRVPPEFWAVVDGRVAPEDAAPETLRYLDALLPPGGEVPDTIAEMIRAPV
jgi:hypothetical protein